MLETYLKRELHYSKNLFSITEKLINWNFETVFGKSVVEYNAEHYAHIELKISRNNDDNNRCFIDWKITNEQIPIEIGYKEVVEKVLMFFIEYFSAIRGENFGLTFEITNGSFKKGGDTQNSDFNRVTFLALINCFEKSNENFSKEISLKHSGNEYVKNYLSKFYKSKIEKSLLDEKVVYQIGQFLKDKDKSNIENLLNLKSRDQLNEILFSELNRQKLNELFEIGIVNKYYDLTLIGFAHILNYYNEFEYEKIIN